MLRDGLSRWGRTLQAQALEATGATRRALERQRGVAVLTYHRVLPDAADVSGIEPGMFVRESTFRNHLDWLLEVAGPVTPGELGTAPDAHFDGSRRFLVTFDDGWRDNLTVAWPALQDRGLSAVVFVTTGWMERQDSGAPDRQQHFLSEEEVAHLAGQGCEIGAHTVNHPDLSSLRTGAIRDELSSSKHELETVTGRACRFFAYPFGHWNDDALRIAEELFDQSFVMTQRWWASRDRPGLIPRIPVHQDMTRTRAMLTARVACRM